MLLTMGGGLSVFALEMMLNANGSFGAILFSGVIVGTLLVCIPNGMIVIHGLVYFFRASRLAFTRGKYFIPITVHHSPKKYCI